MKILLRFLVSLLIATGAFSAAARADDGMPAERTQGSVTYVSGGIGKDESTAMKQAAPRYSLSIEMASTATPRAQYVSDVKIDIRDQKGAAVLSVTSDGPFLLANLPSGRYTVSAARNGASQQRTVTIGAAAHQRVMFSFPQ
jgi:hypothetical protein